MNNFGLESIDHTDLVGHYIGGEIVHTHSQSRNDPNKTLTFANMSSKWVADGFDTTPVAKALSLGTAPATPVAPTAPATPVAPAGAVDLNSLLN